MSTINGSIEFVLGGQIRNLRVHVVTVDPTDPVSGLLWFNATDKKYRGHNGTGVITIADDSDVQNVVNKIAQFVTSVGLNEDGTFKALTGTNYLDGAASVVQLSTLLDAQVKVVADAVAAEVARATAAEQANATAIGNEVTRATAAEQANATAIGNEVTRATAAEQANTDAITAEVTRATAAEQANATAIGNEVTRATAAEQANTDAITAEVTRATAAETALATRTTAIENAYINKDGSVAFTGDQSMGGHALTAVADAVSLGDAVNLATLNRRLTAIGNVFNLVAEIEGGATAGAAFDLSSLAEKDTGDYYTVKTAGYFKATATSNAFFAEARDGIAKGVVADEWLTFAHADNHVYGTTNYVTVTGTVDTGFTVDVDQVFKDRVTAAENGLTAETTRAKAAEQANATAIAAEVTRATAAEQANTDAISGEVTRATAAEQANATAIGNEVTRATAAEQANATAIGNEVTRATAAEQANATAIGNEVTRATAAEQAVDTKASATITSVGLSANGTLPAFSGNYTTGATSVLGAIAAIDAKVKSVSDGSDGSRFMYVSETAATLHTITHNLGVKYVNYSLADSGDNAIIPDNVKFVSENVMEVTFLVAQTLRALVKR